MKKVVYCSLILLSITFLFVTNKALSMRNGVLVYNGSEEKESIITEENAKQLISRVEGIKEEITLQKEYIIKERKMKEEEEKRKLAETEKKREENKMVTIASRGVSRAVEAKEMTVTATGYTAYCKGCSGITALGIDVRNQTPKIIAVDPRVIPLGSKVEVIVDNQSWGYYLAGDTGGGIKGAKIDILFSNKQEALNFGERTVKIKLLNDKK